MTSYLNQGVKAKMCETTPLVNTVGTQYIAARAKIEMACDSIRAQGPSLQTCIGLADGKVHQVSESDNLIAETLLTDLPSRWSTVVMRTTSFPSDILRKVIHIIKSFWPASRELQGAGERVSYMAT